MSLEERCTHQRSSKNPKKGNEEHNLDNILSSLFGWINAQTIHRIKRYGIVTLIDKTISSNFKNKKKNKAIQ